MDRDVARPSTDDLLSSGDELLATSRTLIEELDRLRTDSPVHLGPDGA